MLDKYADRYGIDARAVNHLVYDHVDALLADLFYGTANALQDEIDRAGDREQ